MPEDGWEVPISAVEHFSYCPRQCGLIHLDRVFEENVFTVLGRLNHEKVDSGEETVRLGIRTVRSIPLWSHRWGLYGKSDLVEFGPDGPYPVEYKLGERRGDHAALQLCAQALCLEEMLGQPVQRGSIYYSGTRRRREVSFDNALRERTITAIRGVREMLSGERLPPPANDARCPNCSLVDACVPSVVGNPARLRGMQGALFRPLELGEDDA